MPLKTRTLETQISISNVKDKIAEMLTQVGYVNDDEDLLDMEINLPEIVPIKFTVRKRRKEVYKV